jgi:hypothetical protein
MDTATSVDDHLVFRGRILRREWKRGKPVSYPLYYHAQFVDPC